MNAADHVWANNPASAQPATDSTLWFSTLVDVIAQWGWVLAVVVLGCTALLALGARPVKGS